SICSGTVGRPKCRSETWKTVSIPPTRPSAEACDDGVCELTRRCRATKIARHGLSLTDDALHRIANAFRARVILQMLEHEACGVHQRPGVRYSLPRDVWRRPVNRFEDGRVLAEVRAGRETETADETR